MKKSYIYISLGVVLAVVLFQVFGSKEDVEKQNNATKIVSLSTFVLYDIAKHIAGDTLELVKIIPSGVDIHAYEPTPKIMAKVEKSDVLIYNGAGLEPWLSSFNFEKKAVAVSNYVKLKHLDKSTHEGHEHHGHNCSHSAFDPHIWFSIENMKITVNIILVELTKLQPQHKELYSNNRDSYVEMLEQLDIKYKERLKSCELQTIITNHNAFSYLSDSYGFKVSSLKGLSPDSEPSPKDMIRIIDAIKEHKAPVVFFEDFSSSKSMESLAQQTGVQVDSLHTLGNTTKDDVLKQYNYEDLMLQNLHKITEALACQ